MSLLSDLLPERCPHLPADDGDGPFVLPAGFLWGAASADQQVEHQQPSDWTAFEQRARAAGLERVDAEGRPLPGHVAQVAAVPSEWLQQKADFDHQYDADLAAAAAMGHNAHRFSMSWARLFPREDMAEPDPAGVAFYDRVLDACERHGLRPFVTLFHFASPQWLWRESGGRAGVERGDAVEHFARFARAVAAASGGRVRHWCTLNEPMVYAFLGYLMGQWPPLQRRRWPPAVRSVVDALLAMHDAAARVLRDDAARRGHRAEVGIAQHVRSFMPWRNASPLDRVAAALVEKLFVRDFLDRVMPSCDYLGLNEYGRAYVQVGLPPGGFALRYHDDREPGDEPSDLGWAPDERAFEARLVTFGRRYRKPVYVLENGTAEAARDDVRRQRQIVRHAQALARAARRGADVRGYFHWSLTDNFEWAEGFGPRFGLYAVEYGGAFARTPRGSVEVFRQVARENGVSAELGRRFQR